MNITSLVTTRTKGAQTQCPGCAYYLSPTLSNYARDLHVANCCFSFAKVGADDEELAMECVTPMLYTTRLCNKCKGQFYGGEYQIGMHETHCNSINTSFPNVGHSTIHLVFQTEFTAMVTKPLEEGTRDPQQRLITQFATKRDKDAKGPNKEQKQKAEVPPTPSATTERPIMSTWDRALWSRRDIIYREAYESCCILDEGGGAPEFCQNFQQVLDLTYRIDDYLLRKWVRKATQKVWPIRPLLMTL